MIITVIIIIIIMKIIGTIIIIRTFHKSFEKCNILTPDIKKQSHPSLESL